MGDIASRFASAFRKYVVEGVPGSGVNRPSKSEIAGLGAAIETRLGSVAAGLRPYSTKATLDADTTQPAGTLAYVYDDATPANNTVYHYETGGWVIDDAYFEGVATVVQPIIDDGVAAANDAADRAENSVAIVYPELTISSARLFTGPKLVEAAGTVSPIRYATVSFTSGKTYTWQAIVKSTEARQLNLLCTVSAWIVDCTFDLVAGTATGSGAAITPLGNGAYLCAVTAVSGATDNGNVQVRLLRAGAIPYAGDGVSGIHIPWVFLSASDAPATNLLPDTRITNADFTSVDSSVVTATIADTPIAAQVTAIDATLNGSALKASKFVEATGSVSPSVYRNFAFQSGNTYTIWARAKAAERSKLNLFANGASAAFDATMDLASGSMSGGGSIVALGNDEYLGYVTVAVTVTESPNVQLRIMASDGTQPYTGDGASGLLVQDAGICIGSTPYGANLLTNSSAFSGPSWSKQNVSVTPDAAVFGSLTDSVAALYAKLNGGGKPLAGRKWTALGSSITAQGFYTSVIQALSGMVLTNLGYSGGALADATTGHYGSRKIYDQIATIALDTGVVTLESGPNDFASSASAVLLGAIGDTSTATYYGALYASAVAVKARVPNAKLVFITAYGADPGGDHPDYAANATNANGNTLRQFQQAVIDVGHYLGIPVIDVGRAAGIGLLSAAALTVDGLHINSAGGLLHGSYDYREILSIQQARYFG